MSKPSKLFYVWHSMKKRCELPSYFQYHRYGGRGISLCEEWHDYQTFKAWALSSGYSEGLTIDRINNNGNYEPANCRWITTRQQNRNKSVNRILKYNGVSLPMCDWSAIFGIRSGTLSKRLELGWDLRDALFMPPEPHGLNYANRRSQGKRKEG